jgi:hypothetical protein
MGGKGHGKSSVEVVFVRSHRVSDFFCQSFCLRGLSATAQDLDREGHRWEDDMDEDEDDND